MAKTRMAKAKQYASIATKKLQRKATKLDQAYSDKVVDMYMGPKDKPREYNDNPVLGSTAGLGAIFAGGTPLSQGGMAAYTSAAAKYGAPVAGVSLAGKALMDLTAAYGAAADLPESNTLPLS